MKAQKVDLDLELMRVSDHLSAVHQKSSSIVRLMMEFGETHPDLIGALWCLENLLEVFDLQRVRIDELREELS